MWASWLASTAVENALPDGLLSAIRTQRIDAGVRAGRDAHALQFLTIDDHSGQHAVAVNADPLRRRGDRGNVQWQYGTTVEEDCEPPAIGPSFDPEQVATVGREDRRPHVA